MKLFAGFQQHLIATTLVAMAGLTCGCSQSVEHSTKQSNVKQTDQAAEEFTAVHNEVAQTPSKKETLPELKWTDFPFMQNGDSVVAVISPATLAKSPSVSSLVSAIPLGEISLTIPPAETDWVAVYSNPLVNADNSLSGDSTMVIKLNRPSSTYEVAESRFTTGELSEAETGEYSYLQVSGVTQNRIEATTDADGNQSEVINFDNAPVMAVYEYDESTFVVCEEARLPFVLNQQNLESDLRSLVENTTATSPIFFATSIKERPVLREALAIQAADIQKDGLLQVLATSTEQLVLTLDTDNDQLLHMSVHTAEARQTTAIEKAIRDTVGSGTRLLDEMKLLKSPQTAPLFAMAKNILSGVAVTASDASLSLTIDNPGNLPEAFGTLQELFGMEVASTDVR